MRPAPGDRLRYRGSNRNTHPFTLSSESDGER